MPQQPKAGEGFHLLLAEVSTPLKKSEISEVATRMGVALKCQHFPPLLSRVCCGFTAVELCPTTPEELSQNRVFASL